MSASINIEDAGEEAASESGWDAAHILKNKPHNHSTERREQTKEIDAKSLASAETPMKDEAEEEYALVKQQLGGCAHIKKYATKSTQLSDEVKWRLS